ncbi:MAG: nitrous oxide-stimulated promoter family protein [Spirochaetia bacterium]|nr:nitrous oxide-stimulated promoter family protein [Spirochaetia bacterium]
MPQPLPRESQGRLKRDKRTIEFMIRYYCARKHGSTEPCPECSELLAYSLSRLDVCRHGDSKTSCRRCPTPCYAPRQRETMRRVMGFVGPRMLFLRPLLAINYALERT